MCAVVGWYLHYKTTRAVGTDTVREQRECMRSLRCRVISAYLCRRRACCRWQRVARGATEGALIFLISIVPPPRTPSLVTQTTSFCASGDHMFRMRLSPPAALPRIRARAPAIDIISLIGLLDFLSFSVLSVGWRIFSALSAHHSSNFISPSSHVWSPTSDRRLSIINSNNTSPPPPHERIR